MQNAPMHWREDDGHEALALRAVGYVVANRAALQRFLNAAGLAPGELDRRPIDPQHLAAVLDFLIADEAALQAFARRVDMPLEAAYEARRLFHGGGAPLAGVAARGAE